MTPRFGYGLSASKRRILPTNCAISRRVFRVRLPRPGSDLEVLYSVCSRSTIDFGAAESCMDDPTDHHRDSCGVTTTRRRWSNRRCVPFTASCARLHPACCAAERGNDSLVTTELVHEAYLRLFGLDRLRFTDRLHFFGTAAATMRRILVDRERKRRARKRIPRQSLRPLQDADQASLLPTSVDVLSLHDALGRLSALDPRQAQIVELRYFGGLSETEVAELLGTSRRTLTREVRVAKLWLRNQMGQSS